MASIPLPALGLQPVQQPDTLQKYGQLLALKNAQQQQALMQQEAPLRMQALQNQAQLGGVQLQEQQQALKDQQAVTAAMQQWDGKDLNSLEPLILKNGGSGQAVIGLKQKQLEIKDKLSTIAKNDAETGSKNVETLLKQGDLINGALSPLVDPTQVPDAQLPQVLSATVRDLQGKGLIDQQHAQAAAQLIQSGDPAQIRQGIDRFRKTYIAQSQIAEEALKAAQTKKDTADAAAKQQEADFYKNPNGSIGAPGVPVETVEMRDWINKHPGMGPSDYGIAMKKLVPGFTFALQQQAAQGAAAGQGGSGGPIDWGKVAQKYGMTQQAFDQTAEKYFTTGQLPPIGRSANAIAMNRDLMNRAGELHPNESLAASSAAYKANTESLKKLQASYDTVTAFENTANKNINMLKGLAAKVPDLGARFANVPVRMLTGSMIGTDNMAAFKTALVPVQTEAAKILNSANLNGQLSDSSRHELQDIVDGNIPYSALVSSLNVLQQDFENRKSSTADQINEIQKRLGGKPSPATGGNQSSGSNGSGGNFFTQFGGTQH